MIINWDVSHMKHSSYSSNVVFASIAYRILRKYFDLYHNRTIKTRVFPALTCTATLYLT